MELRTSDSEKLVFTKEDVQTLYVYLKDILIIPKINLPAKNLKFMEDLWHICSMVCTPDNFDEEKAEFTHKEK